MAIWYAVCILQGGTVDAHYCLSTTVCKARHRYIVKVGPWKEGVSIYRLPSL